MTVCPIVLGEGVVEEDALSVAADVVFLEKPAADECYANLVDGEWLVFSPDGEAVYAAA